MGRRSDIERRRRAALSGHVADEPAATELLSDEDAGVRATALGALTRMGRLTSEVLVAALADSAPTVRRRACEEARGFPAVDLVPALADVDPTVVEAAAWALGERESATDREVAAVASVATGHADALCREAAVAALGAIGDATGLAAILTATTDQVTVRRRAVLALAPFEGNDVDAALRRALTDRDWQVRQAAEDLLATPP